MSGVSSIFSQILKIFPRGEFAQVVAQHKGERHARGFNCWTQFVSMLFCQLARAQSLREICDGLASLDGRLNHLGVSAPSRSTLAYANQERPWQIYRDIFMKTLERCREVAPGHKFKFKNRLLSIDSTVIDLCASVFDWAKYKTTKGAVKLHLVLDHAGYLPSFAVITNGKTSDIRQARKMNFPAGAILVFDRGYIDYDWFYKLTDDGVYFVTRMKEGAAFEVVEEREIRGTGVQADQVIRFKRDRDKTGEFLWRRVIFVDSEGKVFEFLTNNFDLAATTIAAIYKERWAVELFFKALKQHLRIKTFVGTSSNALHIQIWTALTALLVLKYLQFKSKIGLSLSNLIALLRFNLFCHHDLWEWLSAPFGAASRSGPEAVQATL